MGECSHLVEASVVGQADAFAVADAIHYGRISLSEMKNAMSDANVNVRPVNES
jgi:imidazole glycerol phosphate synthase subunit HisF